MWQTTPNQWSEHEIARMAAKYAARLARLHAAQVELYAALLANDTTAAEQAAHAIAHAVSSLPDMPDWPDTRQELIDRLKGKFVPYGDQAHYILAA